MEFVLLSQHWELSMGIYAFPLESPLITIYGFSCELVYINGICFCDPENTASTVLPYGDIVPETLHHYHQYA